MCSTPATVLYATIVYNVFIEEDVNTVLTTFLTHAWEFLTPAFCYRKYTVHIINTGLQQE